MSARDSLDRKRSVWLPYAGSWLTQKTHVDGSMRKAPRRGGVGIHFVWVNAAGNEETWDHYPPATMGATNNEMELEAPTEASPTRQGSTRAARGACDRRPAVAERCEVAVAERDPAEPGGVLAMRDEGRPL